jgi:hypothetical protein
MAARRRGGTLSAEQVTNLAGVTAQDLVDAYYSLFVTTGGVHASHLDALADAPNPPESESADVAGGLRRITIAFAAVSDALLNRNADRTKGIVSRVYVGQRGGGAPQPGPAARSSAHGRDRVPASPALPGTGHARRG